MGRLRRFVLVATASAGLLLWLAQPFHVHHERAIPVLGLLAGILSAGVSWAPHVARTRIGRILLGGWVSFGVLGLLALASRDLSGFALQGEGTVWIFVVLWLVGTGVIGQLVIVGCRPSDVYFGMVAMFTSVIPWLGTKSIGEPLLGLAVMGLVPLACAAITRAIFKRRLAEPEAAALPDARAL